MSSKTWQDRPGSNSNGISEENRSVVRKQTCYSSTFLACRKRWIILSRLYFRLLLESCNNFISSSLRCNFKNGAIVFVLSPLVKCCLVSVNPEFGATMVRRLNQSRVSAVLQSNLIAIKLGAAEARRLNWVRVSQGCPLYTGLITFCWKMLPLEIGNVTFQQHLCMTLRPLQTSWSASR